jgi:hypothetical protein
MRIRGTSVLSVLAAVLVVSAAYAQTSDNLQHLVQTNGSLAIGDKVFSNFDFFASGLTGFDPSQIRVTASFTNGNYFLTWAGNMSLVSGGTATSDLLLGYTVTATNGAIDELDASYTGSAQPSGGSFLALDETVRDSQGVVLGTMHLDANQKSATLNINPAQTSLNITKDLGFGIINGGFVTVSEIAQSIHQVVPEPASAVLFGLGLAAVALGRRCRPSA